MLATFKADCVFGATGVGKSVQLGIAVERWWKRWGKRSRLITADPGGYDPLLSYVEAGILEPWVISMERYPIEAMRKATQGWWPDKAGKLQPPTKELWDNIGVVGYEGLTSFGDTILRHLQAKGTKLSQDPAYSFTDGSETFSGGNMSYYGFIQDRIGEFVTASQMLPVDKVIWTATESKGDDQGQPIYGPAIAGKKAIAKCGQWFGNLLHLEMLAEVKGVDANKQAIVEQRRVMYLQPHADALTRIMFPAKTRVPLDVASEMPAFMEPNIGMLYDRIDELKQKSLARVRGLAAGGAK